MAENNSSKANRVCIGGKMWAFLSGISLIALGVLGLKIQSDAKQVPEEETSTEVMPIGVEVLETQNQIASDREVKLRKLSTEPKTVKQDAVSTTTTTTTTTTKKASGSSSGGSTSSKTTKTS